MRGEAQALVNVRAPSNGPNECWYCHQHGHHRIQCAKYLEHLLRLVENVREGVERLNKARTEVLPASERLNTVATPYENFVEDRSNDEEKEEFFDATGDQTEDEPPVDTTLESGDELAMSSGRNGPSGQSPRMVIYGLKNQKGWRSVETIGLFTFCFFGTSRL